MDAAHGQKLENWIFCVLDEACAKNKRVAREETRCGRCGGELTPVSFGNGGVEEACVACRLRDQLSAKDEEIERLNRQVVRLEAEAVDFVGKI